MNNQSTIFILNTDMYQIGGGSIPKSTNPNFDYIRIPVDYGDIIDNTYPDILSYINNQIKEFKKVFNCNPLLFQIIKI